MKKTLIIATLILISFSSLKAQEELKLGKKMPSKSFKTKIDGAGMIFEKDTINYGTIAHNSDGHREFVFTNNGNKPLIITKTQGSCGCTIPTTPKEPILPGKKGTIGVKYATDRIGPFTKSIIVSSNAEGIPNKTLTIKGVVLPD